MYIHNTRFWTSLRIVNRQLWHIPCFQSSEIKFQMMTKGNWKPCLSCRGYSHPNYGTPYKQEEYILHSIPDNKSVLNLPVKFIKKVKTITNAMVTHPPNTSRIRTLKCINYENLFRNDTLLFSFTENPGRSTNHLHNNTNIVILIEVLTEVEVVICLKGGYFYNRPFPSF